MDTKKYTRCVRLVVSEEDYAFLYNFLLKHRDDDPIVAKWLDKKVDPYIEEFIQLRLSTQREKAQGYGDYVEKLVN